MTRSLIFVALFAIGCSSTAQRPEPTNEMISYDPASNIRPSNLTATSQPSGPREPAPAGREIARSRQNRPIVLREYPGDARPASPASTVLLFAGIHGNEPTGVYAVARLLELLDRDPKLVPPAIRLLIIPVANPDGYVANTRTNHNGVDLNRNFPAKNFKVAAKQDKNWPGSSPLSEPESRAIHDLVVREKPVRILSIHSIRPPRHGNNYDGPARALAELLASKNKYNVLPTMGYPTPGSFGSWAGVDRQIPTITLEFPSNASGPAAWTANGEALLAFIRGN